MKHNDLRNLVLLKLSSAGWLCWPNNTGTGVSFDLKRILKYGLVGSSDILAAKPKEGRFVAIEIKVKSDSLREDQLDFQAAVLKVGGMWYEVRDKSWEADVAKILRQ